MFQVSKEQQQQKNAFSLKITFNEIEIIVLAKKNEIKIIISAIKMKSCTTQTLCHSIILISYPPPKITKFWSWFDLLLTEETKTTIGMLFNARECDYLSYQEAVCTSDSCCCDVLCKI